MAKLSIETKARNAGVAKAKKAAIAKAKLGATPANLALVANNVQALQAAPVASDAIAVALSATIDDRFANNKPEDQQFNPTVAQREFVERVVNSADITATLATLKTDVLNIQWGLACILVAVAIRLQKDGEAEMPNLFKLIDALEPLGKRFTVVRTNAIRAWLCKFAPVTYGKNNEGKTTFNFSRERQHKAGKFLANKPDAYVAERLAKPYWLVSPEKELGEFNFTAALDALIKRADNYAKLTPEDAQKQFKKLDLSGLEDAKKLRSKIIKLPSAEDKNEGAQEEKAKVA